jgi:signal transduction histidine kinase
MIGSGRLRFSTPFKASGGRTVKRSSQRPENAAREKLLKVLLLATTVVTALLFLLLLLSYFVVGHTYVGVRIAVSLAGLAYLIGTYQLFRRRDYNLASYLLIAYYTLIAGITVWTSGIDVSLAVLMMGATITLAAVLLAARYALYTAGIVIAIILAAQIADMVGFHEPDLSWRATAPQLGDAVGYCLVFAVVALITWLFGRQIERSFEQARQAEKALRAEKRLLAVRLKERSEELREAQLQEMQQVYRFAELGQISTALLHDLANHLTSLTLDIDDLQVNRRSRARAIERARESIGYLDDLVSRVSQQLKDRGEKRRFNTLYSLETVVAHLNSRALKEDVRLVLTHRGGDAYLHLQGDPIRFSQVMTILIANALDAATAVRAASRRRVRIQFKATQADIVITVSDWGPGIDKKAQAQLFQPFYTTKVEGMGIGLFITKQIVQTHFQGTIVLTASGSPTTFTLTIPRRSGDG